MCRGEGRGKSVRDGVGTQKADERCRPVTMVLALLLAVVLSTYTARLLPIKLPLPLVQIVFGAALSRVVGFHVSLDPDIFFLLFIPLLLFLDGFRIPKDALFRDLRPILMMAVGLVVFTVAGMGPLMMGAQCQ